MISPRGMILPQLPMGWYQVQEKKGKKYNPDKVLYEIIDIQTEYREVLTSGEIKDKYGISKNVVSGANRIGYNIEGKYKIKKVGTIVTSYILTNIHNGEKEQLTAEEIAKKLNIGKPAIYQAKCTGGILSKKYTVK